MINIEVEKRLDGEWEFSVWSQEKEGMRFVDGGVGPETFEDAVKFACDIVKERGLDK